MKKIVIAVILFLTATGGTFAANTNSTGPDFKGSDNFKLTYPEATNIVCKFTGQFTEVNFTWNDLKLQVFYDKEGNLLATCRRISLTSLPLPLLMNFKKEYAGFVPTELTEFDDANDGLCYYMTASDGQRTYVLHISVTGSIYVFKKMKN